jgi:two-component system response regulator RegA
MSRDARDDAEAVGAMADATAHTMLIVDDDEVFRERLAKSLHARGLVVRTAHDGKSALEACRDEAPEHVVLDLRMPGLDGLRVLEAIRAIEPETRVVILTGYGSVPTAVEAMRLGAVDVLQKPVTATELLRACGLIDDEKKPVHVEDVSLARAEWEHIHRVLAECDGNISLAARKLQIHRRSLQRKLQKFPPRT